MPKSTPNSADRDRERERRRREVARRRRAREAAETIATNTGEIKEIKEKRPPQTAIRQVQTIPEDAVHVSDSVAVTIRTPSTATYEGSNYDESTYAGPNVD